MHNQNAKPRFDFHLHVICSGFVFGIIAAMPSFDHGPSWESAINATSVCLLFTYLFTFCAILNDIFRRKGLWADSRFRAIGVPVFGASLGTAYLLLTAIFGHSGAFEMQRYQLDYLLRHGQLPTSVTIRFSDLLEQASLLQSLGFIVDHLTNYLSVFAGLAMLYIGLYDLLRPKWYWAAFCMGFLILIFPIVAFALATANSVFDVVITITSGLIQALPVEIILGGFMVAIVSTVLSGKSWWNVPTAEWYQANPEPYRPKTLATETQTNQTTQSQLDPNHLIEQNRDDDQNANDAVDSKEGGVEPPAVIRLDEPATLREQIQVNRNE